LENPKSFLLIEHGFKGRLSVLKSSDMFTRQTQVHLWKWPERKPLNNLEFMDEANCVDKNTTTR